MQKQNIVIRLREGFGTVCLDMAPTDFPNDVAVSIPNQLFSPAELRVVARLLEQTADRKEGLFEVVAAT